MKKKEKYTVPLCENIRITENTTLMLSFSVHPDQETEIVGAKENSEIWDEDEITVPSNDDNGITPIED